MHGTRILFALFLLNFSLALRIIFYFSIFIYFLKNILALHIIFYFSLFIFFIYLSPDYSFWFHIRISLSYSPLRLLLFVPQFSLSYSPLRLLLFAPQISLSYSPFRIFIFANFSVHTSNLSIRLSNFIDIRSPAAPFPIRPSDCLYSSFDRFSLFVTQFHLSFVSLAHFYLSLKLFSVIRSFDYLYSYLE